MDEVSEREDLQAALMTGRGGAGLDAFTVAEIGRGGNGGNHAHGGANDDDMGQQATIRHGRESNGL